MGFGKPEFPGRPEPPSQPAPPSLPQSLPLTPPLGGGYGGGARGFDFSPWADPRRRYTPYSIGSQMPRNAMFSGGGGSGGMMAGGAPMMSSGSGSAPAPAAPVMPNMPSWMGGVLQQRVAASTPTPTTPEGWTQNPGSLGGWDAPNQIGSNPWSWMSGDPRANLYGWLYRMMGQAGQAGVFDPMGSQGLVDMLYNEGQRESAGRTRQAQEAAMRGGVDPALASQGVYQSQLGQQSQLAEAMARARMESAMRNQQFLQQLAMAGHDAAQGISARDQSWRQQSFLQGQNQPGFWDYMAGIGGAGLGGWAGGGFKGPWSKKGG